MSVRRHLAALAGLALLVTGVGVPAAAAPVPTQPPPTFWSRPYTADLVTKWDPSDGLSVQSLQYWLSVGAPRPVPATTEYYKYTWAPEIFAVTWFGGSEPLWHLLTAEEWARAGAPSPRTATRLPGTYLQQWASSPEIVADFRGRYHVLSYAEWQAAGFPSFDRSPSGYLKLSWDANITWVGDVEKPVRSLPLTFAEWAAKGQPTPRVRDTFPGDTWCWMPPEWMVNDQSPVPHYPEGGILYSGATYFGYVPKEYWPLIGVDLATTPECD